jgi:hypothetical protein
MKFHYSKTNVTAYLLFLLSGVILGWTIYSTLTLDVIEDKSWELILPEGDIHAGDTILVKSEYTKLRQVEGDSERYVECRTKNNVQVAYLVSKALANRAKGVGGTGLPIPVPENIPDLPAKCDIRVVIKYHVLPLKDVIEVKTSKEFILLPRSVAVSPDSLSAKETNLPQSSISYPEQSQSSVSSSSVNSTPIAESPQQNTSQPVGVEVKPSLIEQLTKPVTNLLGR